MAKQGFSSLLKYHAISEQLLAIQVITPYSSLI